MAFGRWIPLADAPGQAPRGAGVFQVRAETGLIRYPRGQSAMLYYGASLRLNEAVTAFASSHFGKPYLCRFVETDDPTAELSRVMTQFERRFGACPELNA